MPAPPSSGRTLLSRALGRRLRLLLPGVASLSVWQVCEALVPVAIGVVVDIAIIPRSLPMLAVAVAGIALLFTVLSFGYRFGARLCNAAREHEAHALRVEVSHAALTSPDLPPDRASGEVLSIASADADLAAEVFAHLGRGVAALLGMIVAAVLLVLSDAVTGLLVLVAVPIGLVLVALPGRAVSEKAGAQLAATARAANSAADLMRGLRVIKALGGSAWALRRFRATSDEAAVAGVATGERSGRLSGVGALVMSVVLAVVLVVAGLRLIDGQMSVGALIAILGMTAFLTEPMRALADIVGLTARSHGAASRIAALLTDLEGTHDAREAPAGPGPAAPPHTAPPRTAPRVSITAHESGLTVSGDAFPSVDVPAGTLVCALVDDDALAHYVLTVLTSQSRVLGPHHLLVTPHAVDLFEGTIRSNITMSSGTDTADSTAVPPATAPTPAPPTPTPAPGTSPAKRPATAGGAVAPAVLAASGAQEVLGLVVDGLDHRIQELGGNLSGGQRQRIALARALHAQSRILVLHEPTTAVDAVTEARIAADIAGLRREAVTLVVTGSPAFLAAADSVVYVPAGAPAVTGTHSELIGAPGVIGDAYREAVAR
ncbi:ABC transporter transmembrane domain-containing protein [Brevibacterium jeotgali]|uniref:Putative ABC transport system ATP-binding protein n=1 Tax=Brevibacterium jeotgali TaxID=1262550 RepID=A0A2H1L4C0_9MICO|nr:ABC transporter ATP-binding protein [Brevibacterium jeotgali]TWC01819.1 putative ABC transport system ATP-binding protein [Brevibacterium jeotgali]SMY11565.1 putative ABC transport system ATP-binding protein [Brevibacterium jeotgali]